MVVQIDVINNTLATNFILYHNLMIVKRNLNFLYQNYYINLNRNLIILVKK